MLEIDGNKTQTENLIKDVSEATFAEDVIEASKEATVIVDFWAPWCGPCKALTPILEAAVNAQGGKVKLAKINVDENQAIAGQMQVQSIPAVFAFVDGQPVDGFMGNKTPGEIEEFVTKVAALAPDVDGGLDDAVSAAEEMLKAGDFEDAMQTFSAILEEDKKNVASYAGLANALIGLDDIDAAKATLAKATEAEVSDPKLDGITAKLELLDASGDVGDCSELKNQLEKKPDDLQLRYDLSLAYVANGDMELAINELLEIFKRDREWQDSAAKMQLFKIFDSLGAMDPLALTGRRKLSSMILL